MPNPKVIKKSSQKSKTFVSGKKKRFSFTPLNFGIFLVAILALSAASVFGYNNYKANDYQAKAGAYYTVGPVSGSTNSTLRYSFCKRTSRSDVYLRVYMARPALLYYSMRGVHYARLGTNTSKDAAMNLDAYSTTWYTAGNESVTAVEKRLSPADKYASSHYYFQMVKGDYIGLTYTDRIPIKDIGPC